MPDLKPEEHALVNSFPELIPKDQDIGRILFWDVGTGNCNTALNSGGVPLFFFDFGGNAGKGADTYPSPDPAFNFDGPSSSKVRFVISHWDEDHCYSLKRFPGAKDCQWLGPREDISARALSVISALGKNLHVWRKPQDASRYSYTTDDKGVEIELVRGLGKARNDAGIVMAVHVKSPTPAQRAATMIKKFAQANPRDAKGASKRGDDPQDTYHLCVRHAAEAQAETKPGDAETVAEMAKAALAGSPVTSATRFVVAALRAAKEGKTASGVLQTAEKRLDSSDDPSHPVLEPVLKAARSQANASGQSVADAAVSALQQKISHVPGAAVAVVEMQRKALEPNATNQEVCNAAGAFGSDPYKNRVILAAIKKVAELGTNDQPQEVVRAALEALADVPTEWTTRILLSGDTAYRFIPKELVEGSGTTKRQWDVLLAFHHGSYIHFTGNQDGPPPLPVFPGLSVVVYSAGKNNRGYVHGHPSPKAMQKYVAHGWTRELHTEPWPQINPLRGDRVVALPVTKP